MARTKQRRTLPPVEVPFFGLPLFFGTAWVPLTDALDLEVVDEEEDCEPLDSLEIHRPFPFAFVLCTLPRSDPEEDTYIVIFGG